MRRAKFADMPVIGVAAFALSFIWFQSASAAPLSAAKAAEVCGQVLNLANAGKLGNSVLPLQHLTADEIAKWEDVRRAAGSGMIAYPDGKLEYDWDGDGRANLLYRLVGGGTCHDFTFVDAANAASINPYSEIGQLPYLAVGDAFAIEADESLRWAGWGATEYFAEIAGEPVIVTGQLERAPNKLTLVSWFAEGRKRPLCSFERTSEIVQKVTFSKDGKLCRAARNPRALQVRMAKSDAVAQMLRSGHLVDSASVVRLDLDSDGRTDSIALGVYSSGAGCGRDGISSLYPLSKDLTRVLDTSLRKVLESREWGPLPYGSPFEELAAKIIRFRGRPYIVGSTPNGIGVYSVWGGSAKQLCDINQRPLFKIGKVYPLRFE
jgi:hypothetical protein